MKYTDYFIAGARIANFSDVPIDDPFELSFTTENVDNCLKNIRIHSDLPYVFIVSPQRIRLVQSILYKLKEMRSPCYPYAVFTLSDLSFGDHDIDTIYVKDVDAKNVKHLINNYVQQRFGFDESCLKITSLSQLPQKTDVLIIGAGITGLYTANRLFEEGLRVCVVDKRSVVGGIWSKYANVSSRVNTSEAAYRLIEKSDRTNRDHSATREILEDMVILGRKLKEFIHLDTEVNKIQRVADGYRISFHGDGQLETVESKGVILAINDRVGDAKEIGFKNQKDFEGKIIKGFSDETKGMDWSDKNVIVVGMGAFAIENVRTALEYGANHVTVVCRRHGTVCPKIIDYLNFTSPYDENFKHDNKSNFRNMMYWKKLYDLSGATKPECWMGKIKHTGHTISVSDIWFVGHHLNKIKTVTGQIERLTPKGVVVNQDQYLDADIIVNCIGFERNGSKASTLCDYKQMYTNNYVDKDFMYLADAFIDDDAFNSFFGSSVLEMVKFYMEVYVKCFNNPHYEKLNQSDGIEKIFIDDRKWSHYIHAAKSLIENDPELYNVARKQVDKRTENFLQNHDLKEYILENKREWIDLHTFLAGRPLTEKERLPYVFEKLIKG